MKIAARYGTDPKLETEGKWIDWGEGARLKIARIGNAKYREMLRQEMSQYDSLRRAGRKVSEDDTANAVIKCLAHTILLDFEGIDGEGINIEGIEFTADGKHVAYSTRNAYLLLTTYKDFREEVATIASDMETFRAERIEEAAKN